MFLFGRKRNKFYAFSVNYHNFNLLNDVTYLTYAEERKKKNEEKELSKEKVEWVGRMRSGKQHIFYVLLETLNVENEIISHKFIENLFNHHFGRIDPSCRCLDRSHHGHQRLTELKCLCLLKIMCNANAYFHRGETKINEM